MRLFGFGRTAVSSGLKDLVGGFAGVGRAGGYIPAFAKEESRARSLGAINPKAGVIQANIGGKKGPVIVNNQEDIFNVRGQTAIVPRYRPLSSVPSFAFGAIPLGGLQGPTPSGMTLGQQKSLLAESASSRSVNTAIAGSIVLPGVLSATSAFARSGKISGNTAEYANIAAGLTTTIAAGITSAMSSKGLPTRARLVNAAFATAIPAVQTATSFFGRGDLEKSLNMKTTAFILIVICAMAKSRNTEAEIAEKMLSDMGLSKRPDYKQVSTIISCIKNKVISIKISISFVPL